MKKEDDIQLTDEEMRKVNEIISGIQSDLKKAIDAFKSNDFDKALEYVTTGMSRTECPLCHRKLGILKADIVHTKTICPLDEEQCTAEKEAVSNTAIELKDDFVPIVNTKKAIKDKKKQLEHDYNKMSSQAKKERLESNKKYEKQQKEITSLDIQKLLPPLPHTLIPKWFPNKK